MNKPLMKGLVGQNNNKNSNIKVRWVPNTNKADTSKKGVYKLEPVNYEVPIRRDKVMNANIKANILSDEEMIEFGFTGNSLYWAFEEKVSHIESMEEYLIVEIRKSSGDISINVFDKYTEMIYDYQAQLYDNEFSEYANQIHANVIQIMLRLTEAGIITGYKKNDYI